MKSVSVDSVRYGVIHQCSKISDPKTLDIGVKSKWNWNWLQERDLSENKNFLLDYVVKISKPGVAYCLCCNIDIAYGSSDEINLCTHAQRNKNIPNSVKSMLLTWHCHCHFLNQLIV